jgi:hypothetical protein
MTEHINKNDNCIDNETMQLIQHTYNDLAETASLVKSIIVRQSCDRATCGLFKAHIVTLKNRLTKCKSAKLY